MLALGIPTIRRYDVLEKCILSAEAGNIKPDLYIIVDNGKNYEFIDKMKDRIGTGKFFTYFPDNNLGVAASWNTILHSDQSYYEIIISNDDVEFQSDTLEKMITYSRNNPKAGLLYAETNTQENSWSLFIYQWWLFNEIGWFDENFWPAYFEDNDMARRIRLAGYDLIKVPDCYYNHIGSATLKSYSPQELQEHHEQFRRNEQYYIQKWGGKPGEEKYERAFNS